MHRRLALAVAFALTLVASIAVAPVSAHSNFASRIDLPNNWQPEGITAGRGTTVYVGSLRDGSIRKINVRTDVAAADSRTLVAGPGKPAVGVEFDKRNNRLWVAGGPSGEVRVYNASTGAELATYTFPGSGFLNDLVVTKRAVYVTDSSSQQLRVVRLGAGGRLLAPGTGSQSLLTMSGFPVVAGFNANGIVSIGGWLIVVNSSTGQLFRVNSVTGASSAINLGGASVSFGDGLELRGATLYVVRNQLNQVSVFRLRNQFRSARLIGTITSPSFDVPTTIALQAGRLWAVNARFNTTPTADTPYWITRIRARP